jgi:transcriptional regulator with XRE-family HTH domain
MNSFGEYLRSRQEQLGLPLRKVAAELDIDTSILSKIERSERGAAKEMVPILAKTLEVQEKEMEIEFIKAFILSDLGDLKFLKNGLEETLNAIKSRRKI